MKEKLIRDQVPAIAPISPQKLRFASSDGEFISLLKEKLREEVEEYIASGNLGELADVLEVLDGLVHIHGSDMSELGRLKDEKRLSHGGFSRRLVLRID